MTHDDDHVKRPPTWDDETSYDNPVAEEPQAPASVHDRDHPAEFPDEVTRYDNPVAEEPESANDSGPEAEVVVQDPKIEPEGYTPPTSAEELLERYARGERYFVEARFDRADLREVKLAGANFSEAYLNEACLSGSDLAGATFYRAYCIKASFESATLEGANFTKALLLGANLHKANLKGANLESANLHRADLRESNLAEANIAYAKLENAVFLGAHVDNAIFSGADLQGALFAGFHGSPKSIDGILFDVATIERSRFSVDRVVRYLLDSGAGTVGLERFSSELVRSLGARLEGLLLHFNTRLAPFDRFLVDGVIFGVLGKETDCHVAQYDERGETAIMRLEASNQEDLEAVADALWERVWEKQEKAHEAAMIRLAQGIVCQLQPGLSEVRNKLDHMELSLPSEDAVERQNDLGEEHVKAKDLKTVRTWGQKLVAEGKRRGLKKVAGELEEEIADVVKDVANGILIDKEKRQMEDAE